MKRIGAIFCEYFLVKLFLSVLICTGSLGFWLSSPSLLAQGVYGYYTLGDSIYFEFDKKDYAYAIHRDDEIRIPLDRIILYEVTLVGSMDGAENRTYAMQRKDSTTYQKVFSLNIFGKHDITFKFLINGYYQIEPPFHALNRMKSHTDGDYWFTTLLQPETWQLLSPDSMARAAFARAWLLNHSTPIALSQGQRGLQPLKEFLDSSKVIGIGRPEKDTFKTFPLRYELTHFLVSENDFKLIVYQLNQETIDQMSRYLSGENISLHDVNTIEIIQVVEFYDKWEHKTGQSKPQYKAYYKEDVLASLHVLQTHADEMDSILKQKTDTLYREIATLLDLQETYGLYYYASPSYQTYLMELLFDILNTIQQAPAYQEDRNFFVREAIQEIKNYLRQLQDLKQYYKRIENQMAGYLDWTDTLDFNIKFLVFTDNREVSKTQAGTIGHYLSEKYKTKYLSMGVGSCDFSALAAESTSFSLEMPLLQEMEQKVQGKQAYVIDLRTMTLNQEEEAWLAEKLYHMNDQTIPYDGDLKQEFDVIILLDNSDN